MIRHILSCRIMTFLLFFQLLALLAGCASQQQPARDPAVALALDGPTLAIAGEMDGLPLEGHLDRKAMVGFGKLSLQSANRNTSFLCTSDIDSPPTEKGRVRGAMQCSRDKTFVFTLRNLGPDQGVGLARSEDGSKTIVFFYHASMAEAKRRLPQVIEDLRKAQEASQN